ncbi:MAG: DegV family protein [Oscillospiraceae bacterium]|nr:DegV family protein [Oscillospiraceae bacterium]
MSEYIIFTDSCCDLDDKMIEELAIEVIPMAVTLDGKAYSDADYDLPDFYNRLRHGSVSSTSQLNLLELVDIFRPYLEKGIDIMYIALSSGLSGTVNSAFSAAQQLMEEYPERKVYIIDSLSASLGQGLMVYYAAQLQKQNQTITEVYEYIMEHRLNFAHWFTVDDLMFLRRGGRLSGTVALVGTVLGIKPVLHVDNSGNLINVAKTRGRKNSLNALVECMKISSINPNGQTVFISHGDCLEDAQYVAEEIKRILGTSDIYINYIGPVIGSHSGPGTVALFFFADGR